MSTIVFPSALRVHGMIVAMEARRQEERGRQAAVWSVVGLMRTALDGQHFADARWR